MKYNTRCCDDQTIQNFMWGDSLELKLENKKWSRPYILHVRNQVTLNDEKLVCLRSHIWIQSLWCRLPHIYMLYLEPIRISRKKEKNPDAIAMDDNNSLWVTHKAFFAHSQILLQWIKTTMASVKHRSYQRSFGKFCMIKL